MNNKPFLFDKYELSRWAYFKCKSNNKNREKLKTLVTYSFWAYSYCMDIEDDYEVAKNITISDYARAYCERIRYDPRVARNIM